MQARRVVFHRVIGALALVCAAFPAQTPRQFELKSESPRLWAVISQDARLEKVAGEVGFTKGLVWDPRGFVYLSDEDKNRVLHVYSDGRVETLFEIDDPDASTLDAHGNLITTASVLRAIIQVDSSGKYKVLADKCDSRKFNSPNDIIFGPDGARYFTDPTLDLQKDQKHELSFQGVHRLGADGPVRLLTKDLNQPNGLACSPDRHRPDIDDSRQREIRVYDVAANGDLKNGRLFGKEEGSGGVPDGMRVDTKDKSGSEPDEAPSYRFWGFHAQS